MARKKLNLSNPGDATHFGSDDLDYVNYLLTGSDQSATDPVTTNTSWTATKVTLDAELNTVLNGLTHANYTVYISGGSTKARNWRTGVTTSNADSATLIKSVISAIPNGGLIAFSDDTFTINSALTGWSSMKPYHFRGTFDTSRGGGTRFAIGTSFPNNGYVFDTSANTVGSGTSTQIRVDGLNIYNLNYATINAGAFLIENDLTTYFTGAILTNVMMQYMWRGIHMKGPVWQGLLNNVRYNSSNASFTGDAALKMENGGHSEMPKANIISHFHVDGDYNSIMNNLINLINAGYNLFIEVFNDGFKYNDSVIALRGGAVDNIFQRIYILDTNFSTGTNVACLLLDGSGGGTQPCVNNRFYDCSLTNYPNALKLINSPERCHVELAGYHGAAAVIDDAGAGINNEIVILAGQVPAATADTKITSSNSIAKIRDRRLGASNRGLSSTQSGDGSTTVFNIPHGCFATPAFVDARPASSDARGQPILGATSTNITLTYPIAPPSGTNNLQWYWNAEVYT